VTRLQQQLAGWVGEGFPSVKMKVGRTPAEDAERVRAAREAIGPDVELMVDANGAYDRKQALRFAEAFARDGVTWFEEPVSSDDLEGLRLLRDRGPAGMEIAAGEYAYDLYDFRRLIEAGSVDALQADATRCGGITGFLRAGALAAAHALPLSAHTAPALHVAPCCALPGVRHIEYFFDHARIERLLFDGAPRPHGGALRADDSRPGLGVTLKRQDAARFAA
jgi:L-alanine-DL-glutamate epimerase-like enolase superfamily enzyme